MKNLIIGFTSILVFSVSLLVHANALDALDARDMIKATADKVISQLKAHEQEFRNDRAKLYEMVNQEVVPKFDFHYMSKMALGKYWKEADEQQQQKFTSEFKRLLIRTYARALLEYSGHEITYMPVNAQHDPTMVTISTMVKKGGGKRIPVNYHVRLDDAQWKIYDVEVGGIRYINTYRSSFASQIRETGIDGLVERMVAKNGAFIARR